MGLLRRKKTLFEQRFEVCLAKAPKPPAVLWALLFSLKEFKVRQIFKEEHEIDDLYFELSLYCLFSLKRFSEGDKEMIHMNMSEGFEALASLWSVYELTPKQLSDVAMDRLRYYESLASKSDWPLLNTAENIYVSSKGGIVSKFIENPNVGDDAMENTIAALAEEWGIWAATVDTSTPSLIVKWIESHF